jgi:hypothetical protein
MKRVGLAAFTALLCAAAAPARAEAADSGPHVYFGVGAQPFTAFGTQAPTAGARSGIDLSLHVDAAFGDLLLGAFLAGGRTQSDDGFTRITGGATVGYQFSSSYLVPYFAFGLGVQQSQTEGEGNVVPNSVFAMPLVEAGLRLPFSPRWGCATVALSLWGGGVASLQLGLRLAL